MCTEIPTLTIRTLVLALVRGIRQRARVRMSQRNGTDPAPFNLSDMQYGHPPSRFSCIKAPDALNVANAMLSVRAWSFSILFRTRRTILPCQLKTLMSIQMLPKFFSGMIYF